ncbi:membrane protein [Candidatus Magnetomorum sp. HK-1]|nr:membrane protein [Candidatus Magnetomorum sp. HK-1]
MNNLSNISRLGYVALLIFFISISSVNVYGENPDEKNNSSIFESISIDQLSVFNDVAPETYIFLFWMYAVIAKYILAVIGLILFGFISIIEKFTSK